MQDPKLVEGATGKWDAPASGLQCATAGTGWPSRQNCPLQYPCQPPDKIIQPDEHIQPDRSQIVMLYQKSTTLMEDLVRKLRNKNRCFWIFWQTLCWLTGIVYCTDWEALPISWIWQGCSMLAEVNAKPGGFVRLPAVYPGIKSNWW